MIRRRHIGMLVLVLVVLAPAISRADTTTVIAPFADATTWHSENVFELNALRPLYGYDLHESQSSAVDGTFSTLASISNKLGGSIPLVTSADATSVATIDAVVDVPAGVTAITIVANVHINDAHVLQADRFLGNDATGGVFGGVVEDIGCLSSCEWGGGNLFAITSNQSVHDTDITLSDTVKSLDGTPLQAGPATVTVSFNSNVSAGLRKSHAEAAVSGTLTSVTLTT